MSVLGVRSKLLICGVLMHAVLGFKVSVLYDKVLPPIPAALDTEGDGVHVADTGHSPKASGDISVSASSDQSPSSSGMSLVQGSGANARRGERVRASFASAVAEVLDSARNSSVLFIVVILCLCLLIPMVCLCLRCAAIMIGNDGGEFFLKGKGKGAWDEYDDGDYYYSRRKGKGKGKGRYWHHEDDDGSVVVVRRAPDPGHVLGRAPPQATDPGHVLGSAPPPVAAPAPPPRTEEEAWS
mmetsp:Transcript_7784/g.21322  ORF Transcript_7784/g.21322 Transcript_7784/m.21322 type:complete len:240 (-) Transcript_7784:144-863(-)